MSAFDELKSVANVLQEAGKIEQYKQILEAQQQLLGMQSKIATLESENKDLKSKLEVAGELSFKNNAYWRKDDGPFCTRCWDKNKDLIRMRTHPTSVNVTCPECKNNFPVYPERNIPYQSPAINLDPYQ